MTYPEELIKCTKQFIADSGISRELVVDIGCGSGQSILPWTDVFTSCVGTDISPAQVECARQSVVRDNVKFEVCSADKLPFGDKTVDMLTCAAAWHWMDYTTVIPEIQRVLKSSGVVAIFCYSRPLLCNPQADVFMKEFYSGTLGKYWHPRRKHVDDMYKQLPMPYPTKIERVFHHKRTIPCSDFFGYLGTWSSYIAYREQNQSETAGVLETLRGRIEGVVGKRETIEITVPYFLYLSSV